MHMLFRTVDDSITVRSNPYPKISQEVTGELSLRPHLQAALSISPSRARGHHCCSVQRGRRMRTRLGFCRGAGGEDTAELAGSGLLTPSLLTLAAMGLLPHQPEQRLRLSTEAALGSPTLHLLLCAQVSFHTALLPAKDECSVPQTKPPEALQCNWTFLLGAPSFSGEGILSTPRWDNPWRLDTGAVTSLTTGACWNSLHLLLPGMHPTPDTCLLCHSPTITCPLPKEYKRESLC